MSEKQLTALRLADLLDKIPSYGHTPTDTAAAAELRRQHALLEEMGSALRRLQLVGAMEPGMLGYGRGIKGVQEASRAALAKWEASK